MTTSQIERRHKILLELEAEENPTLSHQVAINNVAYHLTAGKLYQKGKFHPLKIRLIHEPREDDPDQRF